MTTDAVVRAVTVTFRLGEKVEESTVGSYHVDRSHYVVNIYTIIHDHFIISRSENCDKCVHICGGDGGAGVELH